MTDEWSKLTPETKAAFDRDAALRASGALPTVKSLQARVKAAKRQAEIDAEQGKGKAP